MKKYLPVFMCLLIVILVASMPHKAECAIDRYIQFTAWDGSRSPDYSDVWFYADSTDVDRMYFYFGTGVSTGWSLGQEFTYKNTDGFLGIYVDASDWSQRAFVPWSRWNAWNGSTQGILEPGSGTLQSFNYTINVADADPIPEPASLIMFGIAVLGAGARRRFR